MRQTSKDELQNCANQIMNHHSEGLPDVDFLTFLRKKHSVRVNGFCLKTEMCISVFAMMG